MAEAKPSKPTQDRFASSAVEEQASSRSTKTAEAVVPTGGVAAPTPVQPQK